MVECVFVPLTMSCMRLACSEAPGRGTCSTNTLKSELPCIAFVCDMLAPDIRNSFPQLRLNSHYATLRHTAATHSTPEAEDSTAPTTLTGRPVTPYCWYSCCTCVLASERASVRIDGSHSVCVFFVKLMTSAILFICCCVVVVSCCVVVVSSLLLS